jgi:hypothetical protein
MLLHACLLMVSSCGHLLAHRDHADNRGCMHGHCPFMRRLAMLVECRCQGKVTTQTVVQSTCWADQHVMT